MENERLSDEDRDKLRMLANEINRCQQQLSRKQLELVEFQQELVERYVMYPGDKTTDSGAIVRAK